MNGLKAGAAGGHQLRKTTVEESLGVAMRDIAQPLVDGSSGTLTWTWARCQKSAIGWLVTFGPVPILRLHYQFPDGEEVQIPVRLQSTPTPFNGKRWWFTCPLASNGISCNRRIGKLYLPPKARYFGCRECHELTYRSSQQAHYGERWGSRINRFWPYSNG
jgi:hypothetical protein